jgi:hypothetical protein
MTIKRMLFLFGAALATFALAAPAAETEGLFWYDDDGGFAPSVENKKPVEPGGEISFLVGEPPGQVIVGPCKVKFKGVVYNGSEMGEGEVTQKLEGGGACATNLPGCSLEEATYGNFPWSVTLDENGEIAITGIEVENHFSKGCEKFGVPLTSTTEGTATGLFSSYIKEGDVPATLNFKESGDLIAAGIGPVDLNGFLRFGTEFTATSSL